MKETHLFIIWEKALYKRNKILSDIKKCFTIKAVYEIEWSDELFSQNLSRFYGQKLPDRSFKEQHCGKGAFWLVVVQQEGPVYEERVTSNGGARQVNALMFDKKTLYREWTGGGHRIHATNDPAEVRHDMTLLLHMPPRQFEEAHPHAWDGNVRRLRQDLFGAGGWETVLDMFAALNHCIEYVVMRNYESLPDEIYYNDHNDIDILCTSTLDCAYILNAEAVFPQESCRVHYKAAAEGRPVFFDLRQVGDGYYHAALEKDMLAKRVLSPKGFWILQGEYYYYTLMYHALLHKQEFSAEYGGRLSRMEEAKGARIDADTAIGQLTAWLLAREYPITKPFDTSVRFNPEMAARFPRLLYGQGEDTDYRGQLALCQSKLARKEEEVLNLLARIEEFEGSVASLRAGYGELEQGLERMSGRSFRGARLTGPALEKMREIATEYPGDKAAEYAIQGDDYLEKLIFSPVRHNLLNWYPFKAGASVLEAVAGLGAMTGLLCDRAQTVTALEADERRLKVLRTRHKDRPNLQIVRGDITSWHTEARYDYVLLLDAPRHAQDAREGTDPYGEMLRAAARLLKKGGVLLFAAANRLGLKYWMGASEENLMRPFVGISGYRKNDIPLTHSKTELQALLQGAGFAAQRFYYVMPDCRFPTGIYTDEAMPSSGELMDLTYLYPPGSELVADERNLYASILSEGTFDKFANAYLVEASLEALAAYHVVRATCRGEFLPRYRVASCVDSAGTACKRALTDAAAQHVQNTYENGERLRGRGVPMLPARYSGGCLQTPVCPQPLAGDVFMQALHTGDWTLCQTLLDKLVEAAERSSDVLGEVPPDLRAYGIHFGPILKDAYLDLNLFNAFWDGRALTFFDQEWRLPSLPLRFLLFYGLDVLYGRYRGKTAISFDQLARHLGLEEAEIAVYKLMRGKIWDDIFCQESEYRSGDAAYSRYSEDLTDRRAKLERRLHITRTRLEQTRQDAKETRACLGRTEAELVAHHDTLEKVLQSSSWRFTQKIARVARKLAPSGSARAKLLKAVALRPVQYLLQERDEREEAAVKRVRWDRLEPLVFPTYERPVVSIIIPCYNQLYYTWKCLQSVYATGGVVPYEVILADDNSADKTRRLGEKVRNIRIVRNGENLRFVRNCNGAARHARGKYLLFLNNDTRVHENWLQSLVQMMEGDARIGVAGAKLLFTDGKLQEAGGILWNDGSAWNYGRGQNPNASEYNYVKEADYVSGCSLMVRADLWREIGGFDERYAPAYCEDSDLCFEARRRGYKVMYQPLAVVTHFEGVSSGTDLAAGLKQYQVENSKKFYEKWKDELAKNHYPNGREVLRARDRTGNKRHLLVIDHYVPAYDQDAGNFTMYEFIRLFVREGYHVTLLPGNFAWTEKYTAAFQQMGVEVIYGAWYKNHWRAWLKEVGPKYDVVFLSRPHIAIQYIDTVRQYSGAKILYYGHDLHFLREMRQYELTKDKELLGSIERWYNMELDLINKADCSFYPSIVEEEIIKKEEPAARVRTLPAFVYPHVEKRPYRQRGREDLLFVGGFGHPPNEDAVLWFMAEIWPRLQQARPGLRTSWAATRLSK